MAFVVRRVAVLVVDDGVVAVIDVKTRAAVEDVVAADGLPRRRHQVVLLLLLRGGRVRRGNLEKVATTTGIVFGDGGERVHEGYETLSGGGGSGGGRGG